MMLFLSGNVAERFQVWPLDGASHGIGRSSRNAIHVPDGTISKDHAEITRRGDRYFIRDLGSRNGTRVNGADALEPVEIKPGDRLEVGHVQMTVTDQEPTQRLRYNEASMVGTSFRVRVDQILDRQVKTGAGASQLVHLLAEAGRMLVLPRPLKETCDQILEFVEKAVPAARHILLLQQGSSDEPVQIAARSQGGRANQPLALSRSIMKTVLEDCTAVLTRDAASDPRFQGQHSIVTQSVHSAMAVPLFDNERVLGLIYVDSHEVGVSFDHEQLEVLTLLANMAAVKISNARLLEAEQASARMAQELATATQIQRGLLPPRPPKLEGWDLDVFLETCYEVGGDLYDFYVRPDGKLMFMLGDVTGKGMGAALLMSSFLASARVLYDTCQDPAELATRLGGIIFRTTDPIRFVTGFVGCLDPASGTLRYVNAGHPSPALVLDGTVRTLESTGVPFGIMPAFPYAAETVVIQPREVFALFSDGIPEAQRGEDLFDDRRLHELLLAGSPTASLDALRERVIEGVREFMGEEPRTDDITLVLIRRDAGKASKASGADETRLG